jgi:hypothetical protein
MSRIKRTFTIEAEPLNKGEHVLGNQVFKDGKMTFEGAQAEVDGLANYLSSCYGATYKDEGKTDENVVQEDGTDTSGKSNLPGGVAGQKPGADPGKK